MTRPIATAFTGTLDTVIGVDNRFEFFNRMTKSLVTPTDINGDPYWELYDEIASTSGSIDRVYRSLGDRTLGAGTGDTGIFLRFQQVSNTQLRLCNYQDWSPVSSTTSTSFTANPGGSRASTSLVQVTTTLILSTDQYRYWFVVSPYAFCCVANIQQSIHHHGFERPVPPAGLGNNGIARLTTTTTGSGNVTLNLDREMSGTIDQDNSLQPGQRVWLVNQTPSGSALVAANSEIVTVTKVGNQKITLSGVSNTYSSSSLVGIDPQVGFVYGGTTTPIPNLTLYGNSRTDAGYTSAASQVADFENSSLVIDGSAPSYNGYFVLQVPLINSDQASFVGVRGRSNIVNTVFSSIQRDGDIMTRGNFAYFVIPTIGSEEALCLGPFNRNDIRGI